MADIVRNYMSVTVDVQPDGLSLSCWMCPVEIWMGERQQFPYLYTTMGDRCTWVIHSNTELTNNAVAMVCEEADRICVEQSRLNEHRRISNR